MKTSTILIVALLAASAGTIIGNKIVNKPIFVKENLFQFGINFLIAVGGLCIIEKITKK